MATQNFTYVGQKSRKLWLPCFFDIEDVIYTDFLTERCTINATYYFQLLGQDSAAEPIPNTRYLCAKVKAFVW